MSISYIFFNFWKKLSLPILAITLIVCYFTFPDEVAVHHTDQGQPDGFLDKQSLFYITAGVIVGFNFLLNLLRTQVQKIDFSKLNTNSVWAKESVTLKSLLEGWFNAFIAIINTYLMFSLIALSRINRTEGQVLDINYNWLLIAGLAILMAVIFYLPLKLLYTNPEPESK